MILKSLKKNYLGNKRFYSSLTGKKISDKELNMLLMFGTNLKRKR